MVKNMLSENTKNLYLKNIKRLENAGLELKDAPSVIKWINSVKSTRGNHFRDATKRNIYASLLSPYGKEVYDDTDVFDVYKQEQDRLNKILFKKYEKDGTINKKKTEHKQDEMSEEQYQEMMGFILKPFDDEYQSTGKYDKIYGKMDDELIFEPVSASNVSGITIDDVRRYNLSHNDLVDKTSYILSKMFYLYNFRNEIGTLSIMDKKTFQKTKDHNNVIVIDGDNIKIIRKEYKTKATYGTITTEVDDEDLIDAIISIAYDFDFESVQEPKSKLKWSKKTIKDILNIPIPIPEDYEVKPKTNADFRYRVPYVKNNVLIKTLRNKQPLFHKLMDTGAVSGAIRNMGKKWLKIDDLSPNMITKLSLQKYSGVIEELKTKADNRGHSMATQSLVYVPKK